VQKINPKLLQQWRTLKRKHFKRSELVTRKLKNLQSLLKNEGDLLKYRNLLYLIIRRRSLEKTYS
jgi:hypothetical protein